MKRHLFEAPTRYETDRGIAAKAQLRLAWHRGLDSMDFRHDGLIDSTLEYGGIYVIHRDDRAHRIGQATRLRDRLRSHQQNAKIVNTSIAPLSVA